MEPTHPTATDEPQNVPAPPVCELHAFCRRLIDRYHRIRPAIDATAAGPAPAAPPALLLAEAALRYGARPAAGRRPRPLQLAVLGPTQTGKSTVVNLLIGRSVAAVSPLAGFTVHPQGFRLDAGPDDWTEALFPDCRRVSPRELVRDDLARYCVVEAGERSGPLASLPPCVIWDTPDFDSLAARAYERNVIESAALADAHLFVLSREKYADLAVWHFLQLVEPLDRPLVICVNKMTADGAETLLESLRRRLADLLPGDRDVPIVTLPYVVQPAEIEAGALEAPAAALRARVAGTLADAGLRRGAAGALRLIERHWEDWLAPARRENAALNEWEAMIDAELAGALAAYRRDYLDHPQRYDSFRRATAELLQLLEIPGFAGALGTARQIISWPARKLVQVGKSLFADPRSGPRKGSEQAVLEDVIDELLMSLQRDATRRRDASEDAAHVWRAIARRLDAHCEPLRARFTDALQAHHARVQQEIQEAAGRLYDTLKERPGVLGTLRAARVTADAASIALAIKMGGASVNDLLFAPAMFGLTSMLTEGALGGYMRGIADDLKRRQFAHLRDRLVNSVFRESLRDVGRALDDDTLFGINPDELARAEAALRASKEEAV